MIAKLTQRSQAATRRSKSIPRRDRRNNSPEFKAKVAIAALKGDRAPADLAQQFDMHPNQIADQKTQLLERSATVFGEKPAQDNVLDIQTMQAKIG